MVVCNKWCIAIIDSLNVETENIKVDDKVVIEDERREIITSLQAQILIFAASPRGQPYFSITQLKSDVCELDSVLLDNCLLLVDFTFLQLVTLDDNEKKSRRTREFFKLNWNSGYESLLNLKKKLLKRNKRNSQKKTNSKKSKEPDDHNDEEIPNSKQRIDVKRRRKRDEIEKHEGGDDENDEKLPNSKPRIEPHIGAVASKEEGSIRNFKI
jgi:hypothetical protein